MKVAILSNNYSNNDFPTEWGLSIYVEFGNKQILVDTGLSDMFMKNAVRIGIDLSKVDYLFLTHRHYDHVDGVPNFHFSGQKIFVHKNFFNDFYKLKTKDYEYDGVKWNKNNLSGKYTFVFNDTFTEIDKGIYISGSIPRPYGTPKNHYFEKNNGEFLPDMLNDEQIIIFEQNDGLIVISGCTHFGVENMTTLIKHKFPNKRVKALFAGLHINLPTGSDMDKVINHLAECGLYEKIYALHCTGEKAGKIIEQKLNGKHTFVGEQFTF